MMPSSVTPPHRRSKGATCPFADVVMRAAEAAGQVHACTQSEDCRYCLAAFLLTDCPGATPVVVAMGSGKPQRSSSGDQPPGPTLLSVHPPSMPVVTLIPLRLASSCNTSFASQRYKVPAICASPRRRNGGPPGPRLPRRAPRSQGAAQVAAPPDPCPPGSRGSSRSQHKLKCGALDPAIHAVTERASAQGPWRGRRSYH